MYKISYIVIFNVLLGLFQTSHIACVELNNLAYTVYVSKLIRHMQNATFETVVEFNQFQSTQMRT